MEEIIRNIRKDCRLAMNGVVSTSMRDYGLDYKLNFGLITQQIKAIAHKYGASVDLAERLWKENTRELKILATMIYPSDELTENVADRWVVEIPNQEIREQVCINLFQYSPLATQLAKKWINNPNIEIRISGYWLISRLYLSKKVNETISVVDFDTYIWNDIIDSQLFLRNASLMTLKHLVRSSKEEGQRILDRLSTYKSDSDLIKREAYDNAAFEFQFMFL